MIFDPLDTTQDIVLGLIPQGEYLCKATGSTVKDNQTMTGCYLQLKFEIIDGKLAGETFVDRFNLENANPKAVKMAKAQLFKYCAAIGVVSKFDPFDPVLPELYGKPVYVSLIIEKSKNPKYSDSNTVRGYREYTKPKTNKDELNDEVPF